MKGPEVLAPAGSYESLVAAVNAGADAVYIGGSRFGARAYADNPEEDMLIKGLEYAHRFGVKLYLTVNTLLKDSEIEQLAEYLEPYYEAGIDAAIVQDMGVLSVIRENFPGLDIHASTQMSLTGAGGAKILKELGASRIVPARELSLQEIREIDRSCDIEIETFVHGALCYAYSGQCLMSSLIGGRSGNRGRCAQTCRLPYELYRGERRLNSKADRNLLSCKDLCSLDILPDIIEAGVDSLKIEGRMKAPRYTAGVVSIWRKYADLYLKSGRDGYRVDRADRDMLLDLFDRGGQTEGYYNQHNGQDMIAMKEKPAMREANEELFKYIDEKYVNCVKRLDISAVIRVMAGEPVLLRLFYNDMEVSAEGERAEPAKSRPLEAADIAKQIKKTGNTFYNIVRLDTELGENAFIPLGKLNDLRRKAIELLDERILSEYRRDRTDLKDKRKAGLKADISSEFQRDSGEGKCLLHITVENREQLLAAAELASVKKGIIEELSFDAETVKPAQWKESAELLHSLNIKVNHHMPHIFRTEARLYYENAKAELLSAQWDGFLIRSLEEIEFLKSIYRERELPKLIFDYNLYDFNREAETVLTELGASRLTLSPELNLYELKKHGCEGRELIAYGHIPMMISAQCLKMNTSGCDKKPELLFLKDRQNKLMPVKNRCIFCYNTIYNAEPLSVTGLSEKVRELNPAYIRLAFTIEEPETVKKIISVYADEFLYLKKSPEPVASFTRGHLKRGVE